MAVDGPAAVSTRILLSPADVPAATTVGQPPMSLHPAYKDLRFSVNLSPDARYTEQHLTTRLDKGTAQTVRNYRASRVEVYDCLQDAFNVLKALLQERGEGSHASALSSFDFLPKWHTLTEEKKREKASELGCHELHLFLFMRDRGFFDAVVRPFLSTKLQKTFLDRFMLGEDLTAYLVPNELEALSSCEQILLLSASAESHALRRLGERIIASRRNLDGVDAFIKLYKTAMSVKTLQRSDEDDECDSSGDGDEDDDEEGEMMKESVAPRSKKKMAKKRDDPEEECETACISRCEMEEDVDRDEFVAQSLLARGGGGRTKQTARKSTGGRAPRRQLYSAPEPTCQYQERNWYLFDENISVSEEILPSNLFWGEVALALSEHVGGEGGDTPGLLSKSFLYCHTSLTDVIFALAFVGLPFAPPSPPRMDVNQRANTLMITASAPCLVLHVEVTETPVESSSPVSVAQK